jgi:hypothetical protein
MRKDTTFQPKAHEKLSAQTTPQHLKNWMKQEECYAPHVFEIVCE